MIAYLFIFTSSVDKAPEDPVMGKSVWVKWPPSLQNSKIRCGFLPTECHSSNKRRYSGFI